MQLHAVAAGGSAGSGIAQYAATYTQIAIGGSAMGLVFLLFAPQINRLMHGVR